MPATMSPPSYATCSSTRLNTETGTTRSITTSRHLSCWKKLAEPARRAWPRNDKVVAHCPSLVALIAADYDLSIMDSRARKRAATRVAAVNIEWGHLSESRGYRRGRAIRPGDRGGVRRGGRGGHAVGPRGYRGGINGVGRGCAPGDAAGPRWQHRGFPSCGTVRRRSRASLRGQQPGRAPCGTGHGFARRQAPPYQHGLRVRRRERNALPGDRPCVAAQRVRQLQALRRAFRAMHQPSALRGARIGNLWRASMPRQGRIELCRLDAETCEREGGNPRRRR